MGEKKPEPLDFVKDFQEYLTQQTHHVNMISGSVGGDKKTEALRGAGRDGGPNGLEVALEETSGTLGDKFERTSDGKLKCRYCSYATKGTNRLVEHIRIHTGEKPHRCHLCPFASAYERHLEAHMRSHTGEKPFQCELCSFRCGDQSNLCHHRRRKHKAVQGKGGAARSSLGGRRLWGAPQKKTGNLGCGRKALISLSPPSMVVQKPGYLHDFTHEVLNSQTDGYASGEKATAAGGLPGDPPKLAVRGPFNHPSPAAGRLSGLPAANQNPAAPDADPCAEEKPAGTQLASLQAVVSAVSISVTPQRSSRASAEEEEEEEPAPPPRGPRSDSPAAAGASHEASAYTSTAGLESGQPSPPARSLQTQAAQLLRRCRHCNVYFGDNILYTVHMGCHGYGNPFQCNICGCKCKNKYDFACHFARGQHNQR